VKCVSCGQDSDHRARLGGRCSGCGTWFVFEPKTDGGLTDMTFRLALEAVSDDGRLRWTDDHLYYDVCRRVRRRRILHRLSRRRLVSVDRPSFDVLLERWLRVHDAPPGRLEPRALAEVEPAIEPRADLYGFEQLLVCDRDATADVLLANRFHAEHRCPVLSYRGYPSRVYDALIPLLRAQPPKTVVVVHDADWEGCRLASAIAHDPRWFEGVELPRVVDAGFRPGDARRFRGVCQHADGASVDRADGLLDGEAKWLGSYRLELAAARPRVLMGVLGRVLRGEEEGGTIAEDGLWWSPLAWGDVDDDVG